MTSIRSTRLPSTLRQGMLALSSAALVFLAFASCGGGEATGSTCPKDSTLTYETFGRSFFATNCLKCHSSKSQRQSPLFDTAEQIRSHASAIDLEAAAGPNAVNDDMPEEGSVSEAERRKLGEWLACGAP